MEEKKPSESKEQRTKSQLQNFPNPQEMDRSLAQVIGWIANLIGMVRKFPQGKDRDQTVFTTRKILKQLRALREGDTQSLKPQRKESEKAQKEELQKKPEIIEVKEKREVVVVGEKGVTVPEVKPKRELHPSAREAGKAQEKTEIAENEIQELKKEAVKKAPVHVKEPPKAAKPVIRPKTKRGVVGKRPSKISRQAKPKVEKKESQKRKPQKTQKEIPQMTQKKVEIAEKVGTETKSTGEKIIFKKEAPKETSSS